MERLEPAFVSSTTFAPKLRFIDVPFFVAEGNLKIIPEADEKPEAGAICDQKYQLTFYYFMHKLKVMDSGSGQAVFGEFSWNPDDGQSMPLGLEPGC